MAVRRRKRDTGIGGQAVLEGIMMKNQEKYALAVRKANGEIVVELENYQGALHGSKLREIPFARGIFSFIDSLGLGMKCLNESVRLGEEGDGAVKEKEQGPKGEKLKILLINLVAVCLALGLFLVLPYCLASFFRGRLQNESLLAIIEGLLRLAVLIFYVWGISAMKDIQRLYRYHGAEHKCINCIEKGRPLTVANVMRSSRLHRRCGTSFLTFVVLVSMVLFFFIRVEHLALRILLRLALLPVVAGISYEIIRLAGRTEALPVRILSVPGMLVQRLTAKEPDKGMIEVAMAAVEAVFDWRKYLSDCFGYEADEIRSAEGGQQEQDEEQD